MESRTYLIALLVLSKDIHSQQHYLDYVLIELNKGQPSLQMKKALKKLLLEAYSSIFKYVNDVLFMKTVEDVQKLMRILEMFCKLATMSVNSFKMNTC